LYLWATVALYAETSSVTFNGGALFEQNRGAIELYRSQLLITGLLDFINNTGSYGIGLNLDEISNLVLRAPVEVSFINNSGETYGAAIYKEDSSMTYLYICDGDLMSNYSCFFEIESNSTNITDVQLEFINNTARKAGSAVYGGALKHCHVKINNVLQDLTGYDAI